MRRFLTSPAFRTLGFPLALCFLVAATAHALDIKGAHMARIRPAGVAGGAVFTWTAPSSQPYLLPSGATIYTIAGSKFWFKRAGLDSIWVPMPAGSSILFPRGTAYLTTARDSMAVTVFVRGHADSVVALGWSE